MSLTSVEWSSPVRFAGTTPLNPIPNEIYVEIFDYFTPTRAAGLTEADCKRILSNLALVCRFFCAIVLPRIFKSLQFSGTPNIDPNAELSQASLCRGIIKGQEPATSLSLHVKECTFTSWSKDPKELKWVYDGFLGMYGQALGRMSNLQSLVLKTMEIDKRFLKVICGLKGLQSLKFDLCTFLDDITGTTIQKLTSLKLKRLSYISSNIEDFAPAIFSRIICTSCLKYLYLSNWAVARQILVMIDKDSALVELVLEEAEADPILWNVLQLSRDIKVLRIFTFGLLGPGIPLSPLSMPQLGVLEAPSELAPALVPGRPLHTVVINSSPLADSDVLKMKQLRLSTVPIRDLEIIVDFYLHVPFDELRQLEVLQIFYIYGYGTPQFALSKWIEHVLCDLVQKPRSIPSLRELKFKFEHIQYVPIKSRYSFVLNLQLQHKMVVKYLADAFPTVNVFSFAYLGLLIRWERDQVSESWTPYIPLEYRHEFLKRLRTTISEDFNGYLESVFHLKKC